MSAIESLAGAIFVQRRSNCRANSVCFESNAGRLNCWRVGRREGLAARRSNGLRARVAGGIGGGEKKDSGDDEIKVGDETLRATIDKSKKLLEMQNSLLEQIEKRRNLASTVRTEIVDGKQDSFSKIENDKTSNAKLPTSITEQNGAFKSNTLSQISAKPTESQPPKTITTTPSTSLPKQEEIVREEPTGENAKETKLKSLESSITSSPVQEDQLEEKEANLGAEISENSEEGGKDSTLLAGVNVMNVILVAAECAPWSKTGGLGDVVGALPKALSRRGHRVMVVVPRYGNYSGPQDLGVRKYYKVDGQDMEVTYHHAYIDGVDFVFIDSPIFRGRENNIYGGERTDILKRMVLFCKAAVEVPWHAPCGGTCYGDGNLAFIANDWHTALLPVYLKAYYRDNGLMKFTRSVLVIHNIAHQGRGPVDDFRFTDLPDHCIDLFKLYDPMGGDHLNIFAAGLKSADRVVTVSHGYAWELKTSEGGWGLHEIINHNHWKFHGIVNGIDTVEWNPRFDQYLKSDGYTNYSLETLDTGKPQCKAALQKELGLAVCPDVPLIAFIGRLDYQKGIDLIGEAMPWITGQDVQLVMLGSGRRDLEEMLKRFEGQYNDKVRAWVGFSVKTAHRITAGADVLIMPSRFEPCGLNQLYAMMYGTVPVVHAVGGLRDTVAPFDPYNNTGYGWTFDRAEANKLINALGHCLNTYRNFKESWKGLQVRGMSQDLSWDNAAQRYEDVLVAAKYQW